MKNTIKSKSDVERLFQAGRRSSSSFMTVLVLERGPEDTGRCAYIAGKKIGAAPVRSRCKRVMRESALSLGAPWGGYDVAFVARGKIRFQAQEDIIRQMKDNLVKLGVLQ